MYEEELPKLSFHKNVSEPLWAEDFVLELESPMTKSVGTRIYASPEQWKADKPKFDQRADIFSLGLIFLLLFHPMSTYMEQSRIIVESKEGKIPLELEQELPEIAYIIKRMLSIDPADRPSLDGISHGLKLPIELYTELSGALFTKKENSPSWRKKHFKLIDGKLYIFNKKEDKKAEVVYDLSEWKVQMKGTELFSSENGSGFIRLSENHAFPDRKINGAEFERKGEKSKTGAKGRKGSDIITIENPFQLGCAFKGENTDETMELFLKLNRGLQSF
jgi:serine/threonine protein kinase